MRNRVNHPVTYPTHRRSDRHEVAAHSGHKYKCNNCVHGHMYNHGKNECGRKKYVNKMSNSNKRYSHIPVEANMNDLARKWDEMHHNVFGE